MVAISKIVNVVPNDDYTLLIEFEHGNKILFNMQKLIKTIPFSNLNNLENFKKIGFEEKAIFWLAASGISTSVMPAKLTVKS